MSGLIPVEIARQQLSELISILGELRNAGPRDQRFKQWRQITVTLLQRIWPDDPSRADRFRRIPFSAPTSRADRRMTQEYFERGCKEASSYLVELALELGLVVETDNEPTTVSDAEFLAMMEDGTVADLPERDTVGEGADDAPGDAVTNQRPQAAYTPQPPAPLPAPEVTPYTPAAPSGPVEVRQPTGARPRLKDMLGFGDEPAREAARSHDAPPQPHEAPMTRTPAPVPTPAYDATPIQVPPPAPPTPATSAVRFQPVAPVPLRDESQPVHSVPPPTAGPAPAYDEPAPSEVLFTNAASSPAAQDILALAEMVGDLGVPARERAILRASLIDVARQMDTQNVQWEALRDTVAFAMQYPGVARRVVPLLTPYLDLAA